MKLLRHKRPRPISYRGVFLLGATLWLAGILSVAADVEAPLHDWTICVHGRAYGFTSWAPGHWNTYAGRLVDPGASLTFQYAIVLLSMLLLGVGSCWFSVVLLRMAVPRLPNPPPAAYPAVALVVNFWPQRRGVAETECSACEHS